MRRGDPAVAQRACVRPAAIGVTSQHVAPPPQRAVKGRIENIAKFFLIAVNRSGAVTEKIRGCPPGERAGLHR